MSRVTASMGGLRTDDAWSGMGTGWAIVSTLLGGIIVWGGLGFLLDRALGSEPVFLAVGMVLGEAGAIYLVHLRYGKVGSDDAGT
jgi:F0F1-type ATP synthase assembly protein I